MINWIKKRFKCWIFDVAFLGCVASVILWASLNAHFQWIWGAVAASISGTCAYGAYILAKKYIEGEKKE